MSVVGRVFGNQVRRVCLDTDGMPTLHKDSYAGWMAECDVRGNVTKMLLFGVYGRLVWEILFEYDGAGKQTKATLLDANGNVIKEVGGM